MASDRSFFDRTVHIVPGIDPQIRACPWQQAGVRKTRASVVLVCGAKDTFKVLVLVAEDYWERLAPTSAVLVGAEARKRIALF